VEEVAAFDAQAPPHSRQIGYPRVGLPYARSLPNASRCRPPRYRGKDHTHTIFSVDSLARFARCLTQTPAHRRVRSARSLLRVLIDPQPQRCFVRSEALAPIHPS
jgi:hypothetical protein